MAKVLLLNGPNHGFDHCAPMIQAALAAHDGLESTMVDDKAIFSSHDLGHFDVVVMGTGFTSRERLPDGSRKLILELSPDQEQGLFDFVGGGKGFVGIHGTGWWIGGEAAKLTGGHANWHPPGLEFTVRVEDANHPVMRGLNDFVVQDEIYMSAWDPTVHVLASAAWSNQTHPMAWTHAYGRGRVFFTTLGHAPNTFQVPEVLSMLGNAALWAAGRS